MNELEKFKYTIKYSRGWYDVYHKEGEYIDVAKTLWGAKYVAWRDARNRRKNNSEFELKVEY